MADNKTTDNDIVQQVIAGNINQYSTLIERYQQKLFGYVTYLIYDHDMAADVVQDTFLKAYQSLRSFNPKFKFSSWLFRIAHNEAMNAVKHQSKISIMSELPDDQLPFSVPAGIAEKIDQRILRRDVRHCLRQLAPKYREIIALHYFDDMKYAEIGRILKMPTSTVGIRLKRAKASLKDICSNNGVAYYDK